MKLLRTALLVLLFLFPTKDATAEALLPSEILAQVNAQRLLSSVHVLTNDERLSLIAQTKAEDMAKRGYFSHTTPEGDTPWRFMRTANYTYASAGENLALNFASSTQLVEAWLDSPMHKANMLKSAYTKSGIGIAEGTYKGKPAVFIVEYFSAPFVSPALAFIRKKSVRL